MKESLRVGVGRVGLALNVAEAVVRPVVGLLKEAIPEDLKPKVKPEQKPRKSLEDIIKLAALRAELEALRVSKTSRSEIPITSQDVGLKTDFVNLALGGE